MNVEVAKRMTVDLGEQTALILVANKQDGRLDGLLSKADQLMRHGTAETALQMFKEAINCNPFHPDAYEGVFDCISSLLSLEKDEVARAKLLAEMNQMLDKGINYGIYADVDPKVFYQ